MQLFLYTAPGAALSDYDWRTFFTNCVDYATSQSTGSQTAWVLSSYPSSSAAYGTLLATYGNYVVDISGATLVAGVPLLTGPGSITALIAAAVPVASNDLAVSILAASGSAPISVRLSCSNNGGACYKGAPATIAWPTSIPAALCL
jgi:hypothetical protein